MVAAGIVLPASTKHQLPLLAHLAQTGPRVVLAKNRAPLQHSVAIVLALTVMLDVIKYLRHTPARRAQSGPHALLVKKKASLLCSHATAPASIAQLESIKFQALSRAHLA